MKRSELKEMIKEIINEKKNDFVAKSRSTTIAIHNRSDEEENQRVYDELTKLIIKVRPRQGKLIDPQRIDITY